MNAHSKLHPEHERFTEAFARLSDRQKLRLFRELASEFSASIGHDKILHGIEIVAADFADWEGWQGDDLAWRYLESPRRFGPDFELAPVVRVSPTSVIA